MCKITIICLILLFDLISSKDVILSAGVGRWSRLPLHNQYTAYKTYSEIGLITTASILAYQLMDDGSLGVYETDDPHISGEYFQYLIKKELKLDALPCLFCDATIGACSNLSQKLEKLYSHEEQFIDDTIHRAKFYGWKGFSVDFEPDGTVDSDKLTNFIIKWAIKLMKNNLLLSIWIGGPTQYDMDMLLNSSLVNIVTMDTYTISYQNFISVAGPLQISTTDITKLGFGLLTYSSDSKLDDNNDDILSIARWLKLSKSQTLSIWASNIPPSWYEALLFYLN